MSVVSEKSMLCYKFNKINLQQQLNVKNPRFFHSLLPKPNPFSHTKTALSLFFFVEKQHDKCSRTTIKTPFSSCGPCGCQLRTAGFATAGSTARNCKTRNTTCCCNIIQDAIAEKQQGNITFILRIREAKSRFNLF